MQGKRVFYCMQIAAGTINTLTTGVEIIQTSLLLAQDIEIRGIGKKPLDTPASKLLTI